MILEASVLYEKLQFVTGNTQLEKWSASSIRRAGLCADHFSENSFKGEDKKSLKRGSVPLPFRNIASPNKSNEDTDMESMPISVTEIENTTHVTGAKEKYENSIRPTTLANIENDGNDEMTQSIQWPPLRTYRSPRLHFNVTSEEENVMEWMHLEPPICEKISAQTIRKEQEIRNEDIRNEDIRNEEIRNEEIRNEEIRNEENNLHIIINSLTNENVRLRRTVQMLKLRLQRCIRRMPAKRTNKKSIKRDIQELMEKNKLHPVAKAMINLQLHMPNAPYTEEEKSISKQLYYYSASALRGLRKAGCNFPGERTIQTWHEEYNMMSGFCEFIFCKLQEKISKLSAEDINAHHSWRQPLAYFLSETVKRLASLLRKHKYLYCDEKVIASFADFELTWSIDDATKGGSNLLSHITEAHIRPNAFETMNVKRAFQLFSHTFAAAIKTAGHKNMLRTNTWNETADFTEHLNKVIDACNSYSLNITFGGKRPLSFKNPDIEILLTDFVEWCSRWSVSPNRLSKIPCLKGFSLTVQAILGIYKELTRRYEEFELATGLCNQDSVEHLFSKLRQRGGFNPNPTARMVRLSLRHIISTGYIPTGDKGNVQCPEAESLINPPSHLVKTLENSLNASHTVVQCDVNSEDESFLEDVQILEEYDNVGDTENVNPFNIYDQNAVAFFAGYIARRSVAKTKCDNCCNCMMKTPLDNAAENEMYIKLREYPNADEDTPTVTKLVRPTDLFTKVVQTQLMAFNRVWQHYWA
ncbi:transposable element p transposase [Lasius niger]|uniref:Transposable element p transposase n=1 Tax=Lasius niger TaxID=67767 RepID=A0A0J7KNJ6_LASNI|nr:transposable element p transposase [Lasius niger]